jgi:uncharacterized metal-binding protein
MLLFYMMLLFFIIVLAIVAAVAVVGELRRPSVQLRWGFENKKERWFLAVLLILFGLMLYAAAA